MRALPLFALAVTLAGCASVQREAYIHEQAGTYIYERPLEEVWPAAKAVLKDQGFAYRQYTGEYVITTEWKEEMANSKIAASFTRYIVEGVKVGEDRCFIRFFRNSMTEGGGPGVVEGPRNAETAREYATPNEGGTPASNAFGARDLKMEWLVMRRAAPEDAGDLEAEAKEKFP